MLDDELLDVVRRQSGRSDVRYAQPPTRLSGGFFTENHAFRVADAPAPWDRELVVRLFPSTVPADAVTREATVQRVVAEQGYPAPRVVWFDDDARLLGRRCFVMERLEGRSLLGGIGIGGLLRGGHRVVRSLADVTATMQARLHGLDAAPLLAQLGDVSGRIERWFERLDSETHPELAGFRGGLDWLVEHRPARPPHECICHGDLWAGNILVSGKTVTGVLDYTVATVAEPALDVGFTSMSFLLAPIDAPRPIQRISARLASAISSRYVRKYVDQTHADLTNVRYYQALRCATELSGVAGYRDALARGAPRDRPRPTWDSIVDEMIEFFRARTGVTLRLDA